MQKYSKFQEAKASQITPNGWLHNFLVNEGKGMPGNLHKIGYPYDKFCWQYRTMTEGGYDAWWPYEQTAYWIDSVVRTAILTDDEELLGVVMEQIEKSLEDDGDPFIGPLEMKKQEPRNRWPHAIYFRALYALWSKTGDEKYLDRIRKHYLNDKYDYSKEGRDTVNIETMLKLAEHYEDKELYDMAINTYEKFNKIPSQTNIEFMIGDKIAHEHGVTHNEQAKLAAIMYTFTGKKEYLDACINEYEKIENYHMLPDGVHSSSEATCGNETFRTHESCDISDYTWSTGYLLEATGDGKYADRIERACFNALCGAMSPYFKQIQYLSCVNQVICARNSTHIEAWKNTARMAYQPHHYPECCVGNIGRAMPNYVMRMYQKTEDGEAVSLYGDSVYRGENISIEQSGQYPFGDSITLKITLNHKENNKLKLRIPGWSKGFIFEVNGKTMDLDECNGYITYPVSDGDILKLTFKKAFLSHHSTDGGIYYTYGPFLLSLKIDSKVEVDKEEKRQTKDFPALNIYPESEWRYAVSGYEQPTIEEKNINDNPFWDGYPFEIKIKAHKLNNWDFIRVDQSKIRYEGGEGIDQRQIDCGATTVTEDLVLTPEIPSPQFVAENLGGEEEITLVPYGCTTVRLTVFPRIIIR